MVWTFNDLQKVKKGHGVKYQPYIHHHRFWKFCKKVQNLKIDFFLWGPFAKTEPSIIFRSKNGQPFNFKDSFIKNCKKFVKKLWLLDAMTSPLRNPRCFPNLECNNSLPSETLAWVQGNEDYYPSEDGTQPCPINAQWPITQGQKHWRAHRFFFS